MVFYIEKIKIELTENKYGLHMESGGNVWPLPGQTFSETMDTIHRNFEILKNQYQKTALSTIEVEELNEVCLKIVLYFFGLYNSWKYSNEKHKNRDLTFLAKDFGHPYTRDIIIHYFKNKYPKEYADKSASILNLSTAELLKYEYDRNEFYNAFR